jgi:isopentenyl diphosphate isomerase/L-lactate dehydrogenase-like FMN-dependent dehydrogenase
VIRRREFLRFLPASLLIEKTWPQTPAPEVTDIFDVMDLEVLARKALAPAHWGYLATGVDDDLTLRMNREAFRHYQLRARRLVDVSNTDLKVNVFGAIWDMPIYLSAVGSQRAFHPDGELATARAAKSKRAVQMLSTTTSIAVEEVGKALGTPPWYQLYMPATWGETERMVRRVEAAGCPVLAWTIDVLGGRNTETAKRFMRHDTRDCLACHSSSPATTSTAHLNRTRPMFTGLSGIINPPEATWSYVDRLKKLTTMKLVVKGIDTAEDARLARDHGADGIVVSNHGGRATETGLATIDTLPEVVDAVGSQIPVFVDGGFRRGTDVYKALALGARAVGIGRAYIYGLSAFGQQGVERALEIMRAELTLTMRQCGTPTIPQITRTSVLRDGARL